MGISEFFRKVRTLLEGDQSSDEVYSEEVKPERVREDSSSRSSDSAARLAERMAGEYVDPDAPEADDDEPLYDDGDRFYRTPASYSDEEFDSAPDAGFEDDFEDAQESSYIAPEPAPAAEVSAEPQTPAAAQTEDRLPTRTEVTLRQIEKLSKKLDDDTLRKYQMRLIRLKKETGAVSALAALRILHEYVQDDEPADDGTRVYPDLSAK